MKKSNPALFPPSQRGATFIEVVAGLLMVAVLVGVTFYTLHQFRDGNRIDRTMVALFSLKEEVLKSFGQEGSYKTGMTAALISLDKIPNGFTVDRTRYLISTPGNHPVDITGRNAHFSLDIYNVTAEECIAMGTKIVAGEYFVLGNPSDHLDLIRIGKTLFSDDAPPTQAEIDEACAQGLSVDVIMAFH